MSLQFNKLADVSAITEMDDGDYILTVVDGEIKKITKSDAIFGIDIPSITIDDYIEEFNFDDGYLTHIISDELFNSIKDANFCRYDNNGIITDYVIHDCGTVSYFEYGDEGASLTIESLDLTDETAQTIYDTIINIANKISSTLTNDGVIGLTINDTSFYNLTCTDDNTSTNFEIVGRPNDDPEIIIFGFKRTDGGSFQDIDFKTAKVTFDTSLSSSYFTNGVKFVLSIPNNLVHFLKLGDYNIFVSPESDVDKF